MKTELSIMIVMIIFFIGTPFAGEADGEELIPTGYPRGNYYSGDFLVDNPIGNENFIIIAKMDGTSIVNAIKIPFHRTTDSVTPVTSYHNYVEITIVEKNIFGSIERDFLISKLIFGGYFKVLKKKLGYNLSNDIEEF